MSDGSLFMTDIFTYVSPLCLIALFFFCFCRFVARPCISTRTSRSDGEFVTQTVVSQRDTRRRERNQRRRRLRTISSTARVQPTMEMPPIQLISELGDFHEIIIVRRGGEPPKYEDAIKLKDTAPPAYTPTVVREDGLPPAYERSTAVSETSHEAAAMSEPRCEAAAVSGLRNDGLQSNRSLRRAHSLPDMSHTSSSEQFRQHSNALVVLSVERLSEGHNMALDRF